MRQEKSSETNGRLSREQFDARILFDQEGLLAMDKPFDLPSTGRNLEDADCLQYSVIEHTGAMAWAVHQLDADTTGVNLFVRRKELVAIWKERMAFPRGRKIYLAVVHGRVDFERRRSESPIGFVSTDPIRQLGVCADGKRAVSEFTTLAHGTESSLEQVEIETGRTHQIRIHLASMGHPLFGEDWYAPQQARAHERQDLHAHRLRFDASTGPASIISPLPIDMRDLCEKLGVEVSKELAS